MLPLYPIAGKIFHHTLENMITYWPFLIPVKSAALGIFRIKKSRLLSSVIRDRLMFCTKIKRQAGPNALMRSISMQNCFQSTLWPFLWLYHRIEILLEQFRLFILFELSLEFIEIFSKTYLFIFCLTWLSLYLFIYVRKGIWWHLACSLATRIGGQK